MPKIQLKVRFWVEIVLASAGALAACLMLLQKDWIEGLTGYDPDRHSGLLELAVGIGVFALAMILMLRALAEWRRSAPADVWR